MSATGTRSNDKGDSTMRTENQRTNNYGALLNNQKYFSPCTGCCAEVVNCDASTCQILGKWVVGDL
ncbi:MAG TPA: hypothetical protein VN368_01550 [Candidatus Methylomirabilis sp.]|nr:hypothetical protein [Candidatus Methylomirabilis sp.]